MGPNGSTTWSNLGARHIHQDLLSRFGFRAGFMCVAAIALSTETGCNFASKPPITLEEAEGTGSSLYGSTQYKLLAVLVNDSNKATTLPTLRIHGCPESVVTNKLKLVDQQYLYELKDAKKALKTTQQEIEKVSAELDASEKKIADDYEEIRPKEEHAPDASDRNPLRAMSKVRAAKSKADEWFKEAYAERIAPIKEVLKSLYQQRVRDVLAIEWLRGDYNNRVFDAIDSIPKADRRLWTTDVNGACTITVSNEEPWHVWAETTHAETVAWVTKRKVEATLQLISKSNSTNPKDPEVMDADLKANINELNYQQLQLSRVRWLRLVPEHLDSNNTLVLDQESALDLQNLGGRSGIADGLYFRKGVNK